MRAYWHRALGVARTLAMAGPVLLPAACGDYEKICRPCTKLAHGSVTQVDRTDLDGYIMAVDDFRRALDSAEAELDQQLTALARGYGVIEPGERAAVDAAFVRELATVVRADFAEHVDGSVSLLHAPARCQGNIAMADEAQATCEANASCEVKPVSATPLSSVCFGTCDGTCDGVCSGPLACARVEPGELCEGVCEGACELSDPAPCDGVCRGECQGRCLARDAQGACAGVCEGACVGVCELSSAAVCEGACYGVCLVDAGDDGCVASERCRGACDGVCTGSCRGTVMPMPSSESCEGEAVTECRGQASIRAAIALECSPPSLDYQYAYRPELVDDEQARAAFSARVGELERRGAAILQRAAQLKGLARGTIDGVQAYDPAPFAELLRLVDLVAHEPPDLFYRPRQRCFEDAFDEARFMLLATVDRVVALDAALSEFEALALDVNGA